MNLPELALDLAEYAQGVEEYTADSYDSTTKTFTINDLSGQAGVFSGGGTLWYTDADDVIGMREITQAAGTSIVIAEALPTGYTVGSILISPSQPFKMRDFVSAINVVLSLYPITDTDSTLDYDKTLSEYTIPYGVTNDIRRVEIYRDELVGQEHWEIYPYWCVNNGKLIFYGAPYRYTDDNPIRITYVRNHGRVSYNDDVDSAVRKDYVRYMAYLNLYRAQIQKRHKDNPISVDMFNEAKKYEADFTARHIPQCDLIKKDICYPYIP